MKKKENVFYTQMQRKALSQNGFKLEEDEYDVYTRVMAENPYVSSNVLEIDALYKIMMKLIMQSKEMNKGIEWETLFRESFYG